MRRLLIYLALFLIFGSPINADDHRVFIGIKFVKVTEAIAKSKNLKKWRAFVTDVAENTFAKAGLQNGDIILSINNLRLGVKI